MSERGDLLERLENQRIEIERLRAVLQDIRLRWLDDWQIQPDADTPGLFLQCVSLTQREGIIRALRREPVA